MKSNKEAGKTIFVHVDIVDKFQDATDALETGIGLIGLDSSGTAELLRPHMENIRSIQKHISAQFDLPKKDEARHEDE